MGAKPCLEMFHQHGSSVPDYLSMSEYATTKYIRRGVNTPVGEGAPEREVG